MEKNEAQEKYKLLLSLWASENQIKTSKLQVYALINSILVPAYILVTDGRLVISILGIVFSLIWLFSIGRTLHYQAYWQYQMNRINKELQNNLVFEIFDDSSFKEFRSNIWGKISSKYILLGTTFIGALAWVVVLIIRN